MMLESIFNSRVCETLSETQFYQNCDKEKSEMHKPQSFSMKMEQVEFSSDKFVLRGELYLPETNRSPGILVCHAMHGEGFRWILYRIFARKAAERGFACLLFDFRGCGKSEGEFDYGSGEQRHAKAALEFLLSRKQVDSTTAFVVGRSFGGTVAIYSLVNDPRVKGYALWATPPGHCNNIKSYIEKLHGRVGYLVFLLLSAVDRVYEVKLDLFGLELRPKDVREKLMTLSGAGFIAEKKHPPILLFIGDHDDYVSLSEEKSYENSITERGRLVVLPQTGRIFKQAEEQVASITLEWFQELQTLHQPAD
jgi:alpha/beta superfamily hydrolase